MFVFHEVRPQELDELETLSARLNTLNLPNDRERLEKIIEKSRESFGGRHDDLKEREYVFVLRDHAKDKLIGTAMIIAQHGTYKRPAVYFNVGEEQKYSETLDRFFTHETLELEFEYAGPTEVGGLILDPDYRSHAQKLGKQLSYMRFLYIGMHRKWFRDRIVAEMLPPLRDDGGSDLWDCLGKKFTGLHYREADQISRENVEFIRSLFPSSPIYTALLPERAQNKVGVVGDQTKPAAEMLRSIGFAYFNQIDPFDGGPALSIETDKCPLVERTRDVTFAGELDADVEPEGEALIGYDYDDHEVRFRGVFAEFHQGPQGVSLRAPGLELLRMQVGDTLGFMPLTGANLEPVF